MKPSRSISYRFLRAVTNQVTGDATTVAVVQWDGASLMFHDDADALGAHPAKRDVQSVLRELRRAAAAVPSGQTRTVDGLDAAFPVDDSTGGLLRWSAENKGITHDSARHFAQLVTASGLEASSRAKRISAKQVTRALQSLGTRLAQAHPDRIAVGTEVQAHFKFVSPLSWKNGRWTRAVPWSFDVDDRAKARTRLKELIGALQTGIPTGEGALVAYAKPTVAEVARFVRDELHFVIGLGAHRRAVPLDKRDGGLDTSSLEVLVSEEVQRHG